MDNQQNFENQAKLAAASLVNILTAITPLFLVVAILGVAAVNGWLEYIHYHAVIGSIAWVPGFIFASIRFGSGLGGIHLFKTGQTMRGLFFLLVSVSLTFWTSSHAGDMAQSIAVDASQVKNAQWLIQTALWVALIGELMIATYMSAHAKPETTETVTASPPKPATNVTGATLHKPVTFQAPSNGSEPPQRNGNFTSNVAAQQEEPKRQQIGFRSNGATGANAVTNSVHAVSVMSQQDGALLAEQLENARNNLRAYRSKLRNGKGNTATLQRGVAKWEQRVAELEATLQDAT